MRPKIATIVGARPQFIKCAPLSRALRRRYREVLLHTGQHYDECLSGVFFEELGIPRPDYHLGVGSGSHAQQTATMLIRIEDTLARERPDIVLVFGDTNSTLAGALAAAKLHVPVAHVEAGLRSGNRAMPEEINRIAVDRVSDLLFCPTRTAVALLEREGIRRGVYHTGDVMYDAVLASIPVAKGRSSILQHLGLAPKSYYLATVHRAENTDDPARLFCILDALQALDCPVVLPLHPRTRNALGSRTAGFGPGGRFSRVRALEPVGYLDMLMLTGSARKVLTDSGGLQKEAYFLGVPSVVFRAETEWVELVDSGASVLVGADREAIQKAVARPEVSWDPQGPFGDGAAAAHIAERVGEFLGAP